MKHPKSIAISSSESHVRDDRSAQINQAGSTSKNGKQNEMVKRNEIEILYVQFRNRDTLQAVISRGISVANRTDRNVSRKWSPRTRKTRYERGNVE